MPPGPLVPTSSLRSLLTLVVAAAFLVMGMVAISWIVRLEGAQWLAASLATAGMGALAAHISTATAVSPRESVGRTVGWSVVLGLANTPVSFFAACLVDAIDVQMLPMLAMATIIGAPFGLGLGLVFGLVLSVPVAVLMHAWRRPSPDATDVATLVCGLWLALAAGLAASLVSPTPNPEIPAWSGQLDPQRALLPHATAWILGGLGMTLAAAASLRRVARRRFVTRAALGRLPAWRVAALERGSPTERQTERQTERESLEKLPCLGQSLAECDHLLLRRELNGEGAYRRTTSEWPVAWVPRAWLSAGHAIETRAERRARVLT